jgi:restriction system protein
MTIPDYQTIMLPLLKLIGDEKEHHIREVVKELANEFDLTEEELEELLPSGRTPLFYNRVGWSRLHLKKAGLVEDPVRGHVKITADGMGALSKKPMRIDKNFLLQYPSYVKARDESRERQKLKKAQPAEFEKETDSTPEEAIEASFAELQEKLSSEILETIIKCSPLFFERFVIDVLVKMGYGGSRREAGQAMGKSGDEGIDGIIKEDKLGLDVIYIQAKRWENTTVGRPEIQKFAGALLGQSAKKGIFITTSSFSGEAIDYVKGLDAKIILIDGQRLSDLMIEYNVGVNPVASYEIKKIDFDYFIED